MGEIRTYIFDACALIAFLQNEDGAEKIKSILKEPSNSILMHAVNFGEVYYNALKISKDEANNLFDIIDKLPIKLRWDIDKTLLENAGKYKTAFRMSYADSYVLSMADINSAQVVSTDHHEFDIVEKNTKLKFYWPR